MRHSGPCYDVGFLYGGGTARMGETFTSVAPAHIDGTPDEGDQPRRWRTDVAGPPAEIVRWPETSLCVRRPSRPIRRIAHCVTNRGYSIVSIRGNT